MAVSLLDQHLDECVDEARCSMCKRMVPAARMAQHVERCITKQVLFKDIDHSPAERCRLMAVGAAGRNA